MKSVLEFTSCLILLTVTFGSEEVQAVAEELPLTLPDIEAEFLETFQGEDIFQQGWVLSKNPRYEEQNWIHGVHPHQGHSKDKALYTGTPHKHYGIVKKLQKPLPFKGNDIVLQFETRWHDDISCGGAYLKFLADQKDFQEEELNESSPYVVMFGPDVCGDSVKKVHVILRHQNPVTKEFEEKHATKSIIKFKGKDRNSHLYSLHLKSSDQSYQVFVDHELVMQGLLTDESAFKPAFNPAEEIDDPEDFKPADWVDQAQIPDPDAVKPDDWNEDAPKRIPDPHKEKPAGWLEDIEASIPDPNEQQPEDWDEEEDGEWEASPIPNPECKSAPGCGKWIPPFIDNPDFKGKWEPPMIDNPAYKGVWSPRKIKNPHYYHQAKPLDTLPDIGAVAIEILANDEGVQFDNIMITTDPKKADEFAKKTWDGKNALEDADYEKRKKAKEKEDRLKKLEEGGMFGIIQYGWGEGLEVVMDNKVVTFGVLGLLLSLLVYSCIKPSSKPKDEHKKDDDKAKPEDKKAEGEKEESDEKQKEDDDEGEKEDKDEPEEKAARRRTRRAD